MPMTYRNLFTPLAVWWALLLWVIRAAFCPLRADRLLTVAVERYLPVKTGATRRFEIPFPIFQRWLLVAEGSTVLWAHPDVLKRLPVNPTLGDLVRACNEVNSSAK